MIAAVIRDRDGPPNRDRCDDARLRSAAVGSRSLFHRDAMRTLSCLAARSSFKRSESCGRSLHPVCAAPLTGTQRQQAKTLLTSWLKAAQSTEVRTKPSRMFKARAQTAVTKRVPDCGFGLVSYTPLAELHAICKFCGFEGVQPACKRSSHCCILIAPSTSDSSPPAARNCSAARPAHIDCIAARRAATRRTAALHFTTAPHATAALNAAAAAQKTPQHAAPALRAVRGTSRGPALRAARPLLEGTQDTTRQTSPGRRRLRGRFARAVRHSIRTGTNTNGKVKDRRRLGFSKERPRAAALCASV